MIRAAIFDLDGVLIDSERIWEDVRKRYVAENGGTYAVGATRDIMGMSAPEWSHYIRTRLGVNVPENQIDDDVVSRVAASYRAHVPFFPGALDAVRRFAGRVPLAIASSSNRSLIDLVIDLADLGDVFTVTVSAEEAGRGKPAPDVYVLAAERLRIPAAACGAVEDSGNGIRSAHAAGMRVVAVPNRDFPPPPDALALAHRVIDDIAQLEPETFD